MLKLRILDKIMLDLQRQGRMSFYMTSLGEVGFMVASNVWSSSKEAVHFGSAAALDHEDIVYASYREAGIHYNICMNLVVI